MSTNNAEELLKPGRALLAAEDWPAAEAALSEAIAAAPNSAAAYLARGLARLRQEMWESASDDFYAAEKHGCNDAKLYQYRAEASYFGNFNDEERLDDAARLKELEPDNFWGWFYHADALSDLGDHAAAFPDFDRAIALRPEYADAWFQRGNAWSNYGEKELAREDFIQSTQFPASGPDIYHRRAHWFERHEDLERAKADFDQAIELAPDDDHHYRCRGNVLLALDLEEEIEANYRALDRLTKGTDKTMSKNRYAIFDKVQSHFDERELDQLEVIERAFQPRCMPDLQVGLDGLAEAGFEVVQFYATQHGSSPVQQFSDVYLRDRRTPVIPANPSFEEFDIGEDEPFRCLKDGVWLLRYQGENLLALLDTASQNGYRIRVEAAAPNTDEGSKAIHAFFDHLEDAIKKARCYRGKVLSLEVNDGYSGTVGGVKVHRLKSVDREHVILPNKTIDLLDRNVVKFVQRRKRLADLGMATKKGLLFYGPPGTGKTHTVHYLATQLEGHTTLLITGEQVGNLGEYMTLARLYQPCIVIIEDVDLIARQREEMRSPGEELMLNKLLNEMDGIKPDAEIIFILTTNRAKILEQALASRPGRIDQAIEFPLPDDAGRERLVRLYSHGVHAPQELMGGLVERTNGVSASFIKELMRRAIQFAFDRDEESDSVEQADTDAALEELLVTGGTLNRTLLGATNEADGIL